MKKKKDKLIKPRLRVQISQNHTISVKQFFETIERENKDLIDRIKELEKANQDLIHLEWTRITFAKPQPRKPLWVFTKKKRIMLAWYLDGKNSNFWPYNKIACEAPPINDSHDEVVAWAPANLTPYFSLFLADDCFEEI